MTAPTACHTAEEAEGKAKALLATVAGASFQDVQAIKEKIAGYMAEARRLRKRASNHADTVARIRAKADEEARRVQWGAR